MNFRNVFDKCFNKTDAFQNIAALLMIIGAISGFIFGIYPKIFPDIIIRVKVTKNTVLPIESLNSRKELHREFERLEWKDSFEKYDEKVKISKEKTENLSRIISFLKNPVFDQLSNPDDYFDKLELDVNNESEKDISNLSIQVSDKISPRNIRVLNGDISGDFLDEIMIKKFKSLYKYSEGNNIIIKDIFKIPRKSSIKITFNGSFSDIDYINIKIGGEGNTYAIKKNVEIEDSIWVKAIQNPFTTIICFFSLSYSIIFLIINRKELQDYVSRNKEK